MYVHVQYQLNLVCLVQNIEVRTSKLIFFSFNLAGRAPSTVKL